MIKIRIAEWLFAAGTLAAIIIGIDKYEPELVQASVNTLADFANAIIQRFS